VRFIVEGVIVEGVRSERRQDNPQVEGVRSVRSLKSVSVSLS
jgi:hypothetical protein